MERSRKSYNKMAEIKTIDEIFGKSMRDFRKFQRDMEEFRKSIELIKKYPIKKNEESEPYFPYSKNY